MKPRPSREANKSYVSQEIPRILITQEGSLPFCWDPL